MQKKFLTPVTALGLSLILGGSSIAIVRAASQPQSPTTYNLLGVTFKTAAPFSKPTWIRSETVGILYPETATPGNQSFMVSLRELPASSALFDNLNDAEVSSWVRFSMAGGSRPADGTIERTIMGRQLIGDVQLQRSRREFYEEIYVLSLSSGRRLLLTFQSDTRLPLQEMETMINTIAQTMQELPPKSPEWRNSFRWWKEPKN